MVLNDIFKQLVVLRCGGKFAVDKTDEFYRGAQAQLVVSSTVNILVEHIAYAIFLNVEA